MLINYHVHTRFSHDASGSIDDYCRMARKKRIGAICFTDHQDLTKWKTFWRPADEWNRQKEQIIKARSNYDIDIRFGVELGYIPGKEHELRQFLEEVQFDYVIGSLHRLKGYDFFYPQEKDPEEITNAYYGAMKKLISSGIFDSVGHFDRVKKVAKTPFSSYHDHVEECASLMSRYDVAFELNTGHWSTHGPYPGIDILRIFKQANLRATIGTDCHGPADIGHMLPRGLKLLKKAGYDTLYKYEARNPIPLQLDANGGRLDITA